jgi:ribonuclease D
MQEIAAVLSEESSLAIDLEAAGFHRYSDRVCLLQVSTLHKTYLIDTLSVDPSSGLQGPLEAPDVRIILHGGSYDVRLMYRDLNLNPVNLFDTQIAASLLGDTSLGLAALLKNHLDISISKKYQRADWAKRPISEDMLAYAASDTKHLHALSALLCKRLDDMGRLAWAQEESSIMEFMHWDDGDEIDPVTKVKGVRYLEISEIALLREALMWRDEIARKKDRAPFRVVVDTVLIEVAKNRPRNISELLDIQGFPNQLGKQLGQSLLNRLEQIDHLDKENLTGYPHSDPTSPGRPTSETQTIADRLKEVRNRRAEVLGIARGTLASNTLLLEIARDNPKNSDELISLNHMRRWQVEAVGNVLLKVLRKKDF